MGLGKSSWKAAQQRRTWWCWSTAIRTWARSVPKRPRQPTASWPASEIVQAVGLGSDCPLVHSTGDSSSTEAAGEKHMLPSQLHSSSNRLKRINLTPCRCPQVRWKELQPKGLSATSSLCRASVVLELTQQKHYFVSDCFTTKPLSQCYRLRASELQAPFSNTSIDCQPCLQQQISWISRAVMKEYRAVSYLQNRLPCKNSFLKSFEKMVWKDQYERKIKAEVL